MNSAPVEDCLQHYGFDELLTNKQPAAAFGYYVVRRRPNTQMLTLSGWHVVHSGDPASFAEAVRSFLTLGAVWNLFFQNSGGSLDVASLGMTSVSAAK